MNDGRVEKEDAYIFDDELAVKDISVKMEFRGGFIPLGRWETRVPVKNAQKAVHIWNSTT